VRAAEESWIKDLGVVVYSVAGSVDGSLVAIGRRDSRIAAFDGLGEPLWEFPTRGSVYGVAVSDDGQRIAAASEDRLVYLLDATGKQVWMQRGAAPFTSVSISGDGGVVAAGSSDRQVKLFGRTGALRWTYSTGTVVRAVAVYGTEGRFRVLAGSEDSRVTLLSGDGSLLWQQRLDYPIRSLAVTPDGRHVVVGDNRNSVWLLNGASGATLWTFDAGGPVPAVGINGDGAAIIAGTRDGKLYHLNATGNVVAEQAMDAEVLGISITGSGQTLLVGTSTGLAYLPRMADGSYLMRPPASQLLPIVGSVALLVIIVGFVVSLRRLPTGERAWVRYARHTRRSGRQIWRSRVSYLFLAPTLLLLLVFNYYPAVSALAHSFTVWNPGIETRWVGVENYRALLDNRFFWIGMANAAILIGTGFLKLAVPLLVAELIFHLWSERLRYLLRTLFVIPIIVPGVVAILLWVFIYDPNIGLLNQFLRTVGFDNLTRVWLGDERTAIWAIVFITNGGFPWVTPFALLIFLGGLISIPADLFEAARVDGASGLRRFWKIDLPLLTGQIRLLLILSFIAGVQEFAAIFLTTGGGPGQATYTPALEMYFQATRFVNYGMASTIGSVLFLVILGGTLLNLRYVKSAVEHTT